MSAPIKSTFARLFRSESGNAMTFTALAMPVLVGGAGLAVDVSQWYIWKRELQFAVDQAAVAGAWAQLDPLTKLTYATRAKQEFTANLSVTSGIASTPNVNLVNWNGGTLNAIEVSASATKSLPFTGIFKITAPSVTASAWATFEGGDATSYKACIMALSPSDSKSVNFNGGPTIDSQCGLAALSTASDSINISGSSGSYDMGDIYTAGGVSDKHDGFASSNITENLSGMSDPFIDLTPPSNSTPQSLSCSSDNDDDDDDSTPQSTSYTITIKIDARDTQDYYTGSKKNSLSLDSSTTITTYPQSTQTYDSQSSTTVGTITNFSETKTTGDVQTHGSGNSKWYSRTDLVYHEQREVTSVVELTLGGVTGGSSSGGSGSTSSGTVTAQPGTYSDFTVNCDVTMEPGVYVIDGGMLDVNAQDSLSGDGVMFVLKNGAGMKINGGANIDLTGMNEAQLLLAGVPADEAAAMDGMLIFEDRNSSGNNTMRINGNSSQVLSGVIYMPVSELSFLGSARGVARCLSIAAYGVQIGGNASMTNMCPSGVEPDIVAYESKKGVRLVK